MLATNCFNTFLSTINICFGLGYTITKKTICYGQNNCFICKNKKFFMVEVTFQKNC